MDIDHEFEKIEQAILKRNEDAHLLFRSAIDRAAHEGMEFEHNWWSCLPGIEGLLKARIAQLKNEPTT
jgi:hypothetical protein